MTGRGTASRFLASVLRNGVGRYVCQLQRLTLTVSRDAQSSRGVRRDGVCNVIQCLLLHPDGSAVRKGNSAISTYANCFWAGELLSSLSSGLLFEVTCGGIHADGEYIEEKVVDFARQNPGIVVYVTPKKSRVPTVVAEYLNGTVKEETLTSKTPEEIAKIIEKLTNQSGLEIIRIRKPFHTNNPSVQGQWHPFTNKPSALNVKAVGQQCLPSSDQKKSPLVEKNLFVNMENP